MCRISIKIKNENGVLEEKAGFEFINLVYKGQYNKGDYIQLSVSEARSYLIVQLDDVMNPSFVYMKGTEYSLAIPFGEGRLSYNPKAFSGDIHLIKARMATDAEINMHKNLALNEYDCHANNSCHPHASANVETRGESVFAARNAIDGNTENHSHGEWPYESWGINRDPNAEFSLDFGRPVDIDTIVLYTRADFPHDNWWKKGQLSFSDGSSLIIEMEKSDRPHIFKIEKKGIDKLTLSHLIKDESDPSPFPALTQIEVYGTESVII